MSETVYKPLLQEQETIIRFSEAESCASVYTHNRKMMEKLLDMSRAYPQIMLIARDQYSACFSVPKGCVSVRKPYSDERRARDSERAKAAGISPPRT